MTCAKKRGLGSGLLPLTHGNQTTPAASRLVVCSYLWKRKTLSREYNQRSLSIDYACTEHARTLYHLHLYDIRRAVKKGEHSLQL